MNPASWATISNNTTVMTELNDFVATLESLPASDYSKIPFIVVGNEEISQVGGWSDTDIESAIQYVKDQLRQALPSSIFSGLKFTTAETYDGQYMYLLNNGNGINTVDSAYNPADAQNYIATNMGLNTDIDVIYANINPYWDGISVSDAAAYVDQVYQKLQALYPGKEVVISETGWPSQGATNDSNIFTSPQQAAIPSLDNEQKYWQNFLQIANQQNISFGAFEAYDEPNKAPPSPTNVEDNWGLISANSGPTYTGSTFKTAITSLLDSVPPPVVTSVTTLPATGVVDTGGIVTLTLAMSEAVSVSGGTPSLSLNDGGTAVYDPTKSTGSALVFDYSVQSTDTTTTLAVTGLNLNGASVQTSTGGSASITGVQATFSGLAINVPLINTLTISQQLELVYIGYFNRPGDGSGFAFWSQQDTTARANGQTEATALNNIANSFAPQQETYALYPILMTPNLNLQSTSAQASLNSFVGNVYVNLLGRPADASGQAYWVSQITNGSIGLGAAVLAIANGAQGSDATIVQNKITVALDFTTRTTAAGLGITSVTIPYATALLTVLRGVDNLSLSDASVTAAEAITTAYVQAATAQPSAVGGVTAPVDATTLGLNDASAAVSNATARTDDHVSLPSGSVDQTLALTGGVTYTIDGFDPAAGDVLDLAPLLASAHLTSSDVLPNLSSYFTVGVRSAELDT